MASIAEDIEDYLVNQCSISGVYVAGLPTTPDDVVSINLYGGPQPIVKNGGGVHWRMQRAQILVRARAKADALATIESIYPYVANAINITVGSTFYDKIVVLNEPQQLQMDDDNRAVYFINIEAWRRGL